MKKVLQQNDVEHMRKIKLLDLPKNKKKYVALYRNVPLNKNEMYTNKQIKQTKYK